MHLEGTHTFAAPPERLFGLLNDADVLARTTPGLESLEADPEVPDRYRARFHIKLGPINGGFEGTLAVVDKEPPRAFGLVIDVTGRIGSATATGTFRIDDHEEGATVAFAGDAHMKGVLARMGGRVLSGVARLFTNQFFAALEREL